MMTITGMKSEWLITLLAIFLDIELTGTHRHTAQQKEIATNDRGASVVCKTMGHFGAFLTLHTPAWWERVDDWCVRGTSILHSLFHTQQRKMDTSESSLIIHYTHISSWYAYQIRNRRCTSLWIMQLNMKDEESNNWLILSSKKKEAFFKYTFTTTIDTIKLHQLGEYSIVYLLRLLR